MCQLLDGSGFLECHCPFITKLSGARKGGARELAQALRGILWFNDSPLNADQLCLWVLNSTGGGLYGDTPLLIFKLLGPGHDHLSLPQQLVVDPDSVNYKLIKMWLEVCEKAPTHGEYCGLSSSVQPNTLQLIDVRNGKVVDAPQQARYVALSYVWGTRFQTEGFSVVVQDSIRVAKELSYHYLWADAHCIDQKDTVNKHEQISNMHLIYGRADLMLIAAAGQDSSYGLPGVSSRRRTPQPWGFFGGKMLVVQPSPRKDILLEGCHWSKRGWTYQDALLSRRRLVFTHHYVFWQCSWEAHEEGFRWSLYDSRPFETGSVSDRDVIMPPRVGLLQEHIERYALRQLTFESDRWNAFLGILGNQERYSPPIYHIWGIPVTYRFKQWHLFSLAWTTALPTHRCSTFPSWSWTAWSAGQNMRFTQAIDKDPPFKARLAKDDRCDTADIISLKLFGTYHQQYRAYSTGTHYLRVQDQIGVLPLQTVNDKHYVGLQGPAREMLLRFDLLDLDFSISDPPQQVIVPARQATNGGSKMHSYRTQWLFIVIFPQQDGSYRRIGSFILLRDAVLESFEEEWWPEIFRGPGGELSESRNSRSHFKPTKNLHEIYTTGFYWLRIESKK
ncbi:heterokaryon incompatibility protein-domain-containing protein [Podospora fimiseda]|uniref:Heterokaryon incompatibility protein-domain-containing protein n=1 Tax=Podospora fimiseda TaxID=252190 RepID=A0AAN7BRI6_9PEZI|nr:heterokaryon incompatibility protein-domain-containing protein [Podospora fimiseda]